MRKRDESLFAIWENVPGLFGMNKIFLGNLKGSTIKRRFKTGEYKKRKGGFRIERIF